MYLNAATIDECEINLPLKPAITMNVELVMGLDSVLGREIFNNERHGCE